MQNGASSVTAVWEIGRKNLKITTEQE